MSMKGWLMQETIDRLLLNKNITIGQKFWLTSVGEMINTFTLEQAIFFTKRLTKIEEELNAKSL